MTKTLRATTIIPPELYVHRGADRQVRRVLEEMGRPGYVLVARQMGKTNLLLNAKRELQTSADAFIYVDLSNPFETARDCFRNIIDTAIDSRPETFASASTVIKNGRASDPPAHKEHERELRELLRGISGKLVVILDEIDSLTTSSFSDQIFAQIRSTYFSRVNIPEYARLTYILSGVAEPSELIKNPKLSPFNIGEKIYLDDFNRDEFLEFIARSGLKLEIDAVNRIHYWTNGNPRITWDVCAAVEDAIEANQAITPGVVDRIVADLYLTSFDRAPIDHMRTLAEMTPEIRNALTEIRYGKAAALSDSVRSKLYLAGIISSARDNPRIKNPIIDLSLSDDWLRDVEKRNLGLLSLASGLLSRGRYKEAIETLEEFLSKGTPSTNERLSAIEDLSNAHYLLGNYRESLNWLSQGRFDKDRVAELHFTQVYREGLCHFYLNDFAASAKCFKQVVEWNSASKHYHQSLINLASSYYSLDPELHREEFFALLNRVLDEIDGASAFSPTERNSLKVAARYNLSKMYQRLGDIAAAIKELELALDSAAHQERAVVLAELASLVTDHAHKQKLVASGVDLIVDEKLAPIATPSELQLNLSPGNVSLLLATAFAVDPQGAFEKLLAYWTDGGGHDGAGLDFVFDLFARVAPSGPDAMLRLAKRLTRAATEVGAQPALFFSAKMLAFYSQREPEHPSHVENYLALLATQEPNRSLDPIDTSVLNSYMASAVRREDFERISSLLAMLEPFRPFNSPGDFLLFDFYSMITAGVRGDQEFEKSRARTLLENLDAGHVSRFVANEDLKLIKRAATAVLARPNKIAVNAPGVRRPRNEKVTVRYKDGSIVTAKFKKLETDINSGACEILS